jgi:hypothetical protein
MQSAAAPLAIRAMGFAPSVIAAIPAISVAASRFASIGASAVFLNESTPIYNAAKNPYSQVIACILFLSIIIAQQD